MPLPFHPNSKIGDLAEDDVPLQRGINTMILVLNWLHLNMPAKVPRDFCIYNELTAEQRAVLQNLVRLTGEWSSIGPIAAADMGRAAGKIENIEEQLRSLSAVALHLVAAGGSSRASQSGPRVEKSKQKSSVFGDVQLAKDVESKRLHFGGSPTFDPTNLLEPTTREIFQHPIDCAMDPADSNADPPHVQTRGSRKEILALLDSLDRTNRLQLFRAEDVLMTHRAGLFSLMKNLSTDRLIRDSRPFNCLEYPLNQWTQSMGSIQPLLDTFLRSDNVLLCSGEDLKDYYYYYRVSDQRARRNAICIQLTPKEASRYKCFSNAPQGAFLCARVGHDGDGRPQRCWDWTAKSHDPYLVIGCADVWTTYSSWSRSPRANRIWGSHRWLDSHRTGPPQHFERSSKYQSGEQNGTTIS